MSKRIPPSGWCGVYPKWSNSRFMGFIRGNLRRAFTRWPPKYDVLAKAKRIKPKNKAGRHKYEYQCAVCEKWYVQSQVEVDHIIPCGSLKDYDDLPGFVERLFAPVDKLQVICKSCHRTKTKGDKSADK